MAGTPPTAALYVGFCGRISSIKPVSCCRRGVIMVIVTLTLNMFLMYHVFLGFLLDVGVKASVRL